MEATAPSARGRTFTIVATLLAATNMIDFIFYGMHAHDALAGIGMALIAHRAWHGGLEKHAAGPAGQSAPGQAAARQAARSRVAGVVGAALVVASIFAKYVVRGVAWA
jgi:hypothetical protein